MNGIEIPEGTDALEIGAEDLEEVGVGFAVAVRADRGQVAAPANEVTSLVQYAIEQKVPVEVLERLVALQERVTERNARQAFFAAISRFQSEVGPVPKTAAVTVERNGVAQVRSRFAPLHVIADHIREPLSRNGLMYSWDSTLDGAEVEVRCTVRHVDGHSETSSVRFPAAGAAAPGMNGVQAAGSARTYGERYSLVQALGLTTADVDDDGQGADKGGQEKGPVITEAQAADLRALMQEVGANEMRFLKWAQVERVEAIPAAALKEAISALEQKRRASA